MLRTRLFLYLIPFVAILLAVGVYAILLFSRLADHVDITVTKGYQSVIAAQTMSLALSRMDTAARTEGNPNTADFDKHAQLFEGKLTIQIKNATLPGEDILTEALRTNYLSFRTAGRAALNQRERSEQMRIIDQELDPLGKKTEPLLEEIRRINHEDISAITQNIRRINQRITRLMVIGIGVAFGISVYASVKLGKSILQPIQSLTRAAREIGQGNLDQTVPVLSSDELGELANAFNGMAAQLKDYRRSTTEKLIRLHHTMESTLASFPDPIFVLDREGQIELKNPAAEELSARLDLHNSLPAQLQDTALNVIRTGTDFLPHSFEEVLAFRVDGAERSFLPRILTMRGEKHQPVGVAVVLYDVTRFRLLDDAKTNLVATVSHELKTPLTSVRMVLHLLLEKTLGPLTSKQGDLLETARRDAERLLRILNDLLDLARLQAGNTELKKERTTPVQLVQSISDEAQRSVVERGLRFTCSVQPRLPAVLVDPQRISHVFRNFITNAIKHSPAAGEIKVRATRTQNGGVQFSVIDQGPGIPEEFQARIFDRFFRVPGQTKTGAGLGLSIAREIVVAHGGRIGVRSPPGQGSEFYIVLNGAGAESKA